MTNKLTMKQLFKLFTLALLCSSSVVFAQTTVSGTVTDNAGVPLPGASVLIVGTSIGTTSNFEGDFTLESDYPTPWNLEIKYAGYAPLNFNITGNQSGLNATLQEDALGLNEVVISASRKAEKITEAPASISLISPVEVKKQVQSNPTLLLAKTQGVQLVQTGADRFQITLRGQSSTFLSNTFVMLDNMPLTSLSQQTYFYTTNPFAKLDIDRVEVIRGPGSALYGGNVTGGVVHYISKSPFTSQGTTVELTAGTLNTYQIAARHAGVSKNEKLGYKVNAFYKRGDEWQYDPNDELDRVQLGRIRSRVVSPIDGSVIFENEERTTDDGFTYFVPQDYIEYYGVDGTLEYKASDNLTLSALLGYNSSDFPFWTTNGFGVNRPSGIKSQFRLAGKNTFFSASYFRTKLGFEEDNVGTLIISGPAAVGSTATSQDTENFDAQFQHRINDLGKLDLVLGADVRIGTTDSQRALYTRTEDDNDIEIYGAYTQAVYDISEKFSLTGALRVDHFAPLEETRLSPRLAGVYKPNDRSSFRASLNKAFAGPGSIQLYIDLGPLGPVRQGGGVPGPPIGFQRNVGSADPLTFDSSPISFGGTALALGESGADKLISHQSVIDALIAANPALAAALGGINTSNTSTPRTVALNNGGAIIGEAPVVNNRALELTEQTTYEIGYTGFIGEKLSITADFYYNDIKNASALSTPFTRAVTSGGLANEVLATITGATTLNAQEQADVTDALLAIFPDNDESIIGAIQSEQIRASINNGELATSPAPRGGLWIERNFFSATAIDYYGIDLGVKYFFTNNINGYINYSWLSETEFNDNGTAYNLNTPKTRFGAGLAYNPSKGFNAQANLRYQDAFTAINGFYSGDVDAYTLLDLGAGYSFGNGISLRGSLTNATNVDFRPLPNLPAIGAQFLGSIRYDF